MVSKAKDGSETPSLPFCPEDIAILQARLAEAIEPVYIAWRKQEGPRPGDQRKHVFDLPDGVRVIISIDQFDEGRPFILHLSCSVCPGTDVFEAICGRSPMCNIANVASVALSAAYTLFDMHVPLTCVAVTKNGIHFVGPDRDELLADLKNRPRPCSPLTSNPPAAAGEKDSL